MSRQFRRGAPEWLRAGSIRGWANYGVALPREAKQAS